MIPSKTPSPSSVFAGQTNEALLPLAQLYHRWFLRTCEATYRGGHMDNPRGDVFAHVRSLLVQADSLANALERVSALLGEELSEDARSLIVQARDLVAQVEQAGSITPLVAGETDGFRHLCQRCTQQCSPDHSIRFFNARERRLLLRPEVSGALRSEYARCQLCKQALNPSSLVSFLPAGTHTHTSGCRCGNCNKAGRASVLHVYACDWQTQLPSFPFVLQVEAPSRRQCIERAVKHCWRAGWYVLNKEVLPPLSAPSVPAGAPAASAS